MHNPTDKIAHTTVFVTPVVEHWLEQEIAQWVHPMKDRSDDPSHYERTLLPRSYISLPLSGMRIKNTERIAHEVVAVGFISHYLNGLFIICPLINVLSVSLNKNITFIFCSVSHHVL